MSSPLLISRRGVLAGLGATLGLASASAVEAKPVVAKRFDRAQAIDAALKAFQGKIALAPNPFPGSTLFVPVGRAPKAGMLLLHGSEGGNAPFTVLDAARLASKGYSALAYAYCDVPGTPLPAKLANVEIGTTERAARWLKSSPHSGNAKRIGLFGFSRGAEQALLLASRARNSDLFAAVAVHAPSPWVWASVDPVTKMPVRGSSGLLLPAWLEHGVEVSPETRIPIERYDGPAVCTKGCSTS